MKRLTKKRKTELREWMKTQALKTKDLKHKQNLATLYELLEAFEILEKDKKQLDAHFDYNFDMHRSLYKNITDHQKGKLIKLRKGEYNAN